MSFLLYQFGLPVKSDFFSLQDLMGAWSTVLSGEKWLDVYFRIFGLKTNLYKYYNEY